MLIRMKSGDNHYVIGQSDINAVKNAGGLPVLIPVMNSTEDIPEQVTNIDALYIPGGPDINTLLFGEEPIIGMGSSRRTTGPMISPRALLPFRAAPCRRTSRSAIWS